MSKISKTGKKWLNCWIKWVNSQYIQALARFLLCPWDKLKEYCVAIAFFSPRAQTSTRKKWTKLRSIAKPSFDSNPFQRLGQIKKCMFLLKQAFFFFYGTSTKHIHTHTQDLRAAEITIWTEVVAANPPPPPLLPLCLMWRYTSVLKHQTEAIAFHFHNWNWVVRCCSKLSGGTRRMREKQGTICIGFRTKSVAAGLQRVRPHAFSVSLCTRLAL